MLLDNLMIPLEKAPVPPKDPQEINHKIGSESRFARASKVSDISHTIEKGQRFISEANNYIDSDVLDRIRGKFVPAGTIIFAKIGEAIRSNRRVITTKPAVIDNNTAGVKAMKAKSSDEFLFYLWSNVSLMDHAGGVVPAVSKLALENLRLCYPSDLTEQQRIADCLGSLDNLIAAEGRKLEALRQHKQGLMQQLFPQPGETVPQLRFPEFRDGPEWDIMTLSSASDVNPSNDGLPEFFIYIDLESVKSSMLIERKAITRDAAPSRAQRYLNRKDIIYQTVRPYQRNNLFFDINDGCEYVASTGYAQLRAHESPEFLYQLLHTDSFVSSVLARCTGSNYPAINPSALASIDVVLPRKTEQQKIADCLGSLDDLIAAEGWKLETLRQHKQGLMQQLFPSLDGNEQ